jgi:hypothetical protein
VYRSLAVLADVQAVGKPYRYLEGRAVPYDTFGDVMGIYLEAHKAGAFNRSTNGNKARSLPLMLFHDNARWPIGHAESWKSKPDGLHGLWKLNDSNDAQQAAQMAEDGDLTGMSIGFQPVKSEWSRVDDWAPELGPEHMDKVLRTESALFEVSLTPTPVFADAMVTNVHTDTTRDAFILVRAQRQAELEAKRDAEVSAWRDYVRDIRR